MARIAERELERLKREVAVERLAAARGVELRRHGADLVGLCPFHDDHTPSLVITPGKNLWHCLGACRAGGGPIDWVMRAEGVSFRHAVELLQSGYSPGGGGPAVKRSSVALLQAPVTAADDAAALTQVAGFYHEALRQGPEARAYLGRRGLEDGELIERFRLGFANRTLGYRLPAANRKAGAELRGRLQRLGILRESGHEHFNGSLVVPIMSLDGEVLGMYGRKITAHLRAGTPDHLYLPGPRRGVWNEAGVAEAGGEVILCEALLDAMTFWRAGFHNVTASYGVNGFTDDHRAALTRHGVRRVYLAYDRDEAGDKAAAALAEELMAQGIECLRVLFPRGMDANEYALKVMPAAKSLAVLVRAAEWLGKKAVSHQPSAVSLGAAAADGAPGAGGAAAAGAGEAGPKDKAAQPNANAAPAAPGSGDEIEIVCGERRYRARGLGKNLGGETLRVQLRAWRAGGGLHIDSVDLYAARQRQAFIRQAAEEMEAPEDAVRRDLHEVLARLEAEQERRRAAAAALTAAPETAMSERERAEAMDLLRSPDLARRIVGDFARCGVAGEERNLLAAYLACTSRRLRQPLAVVVQSSTAAGKSALMDAVLEFMPEEETQRYSAMTGQALYYMGSANLKHKILAIAEEEGASRAAYALKLLQSEGSLRIAATGKDAETGKLSTHEYTVEGPAMIFLTTTAAEVDEELLNRCLVLAVDEEREQTRAIHERQRERETLAGLLQSAERRGLAALHRNAQRLLEPVEVVNEHARRLEFPDLRTRSRRDHAKYLTLIRAVALLHQHQRRRREARGISYIEAAPGDIALANDIAREVLGRGMADLAPQTRRLAGLLDRMVRAGMEREGLRRGEYRFTRRQAREATGWAPTQMQAHLRRLEELEYIVAHRGARGQSFVYELCCEVDADGGACLLPGLIEVEGCVYDGNLSGETGDLSGPNRGQIGPDRVGVGSAFDRMNTDPFTSLAAKEEETAHQELDETRVVAASGGA